MFEILEIGSQCKVVLIGETPYELRTDIRT